MDYTDSLKFALVIIVQVVGNRFIRLVDVTEDFYSQHWLFGSILSEARVRNYDIAVKVNIQIV